jgi:hypothetical protein
VKRHPNGPALRIEVRSGTGLPDGLVERARSTALRRFARHAPLLERIAIRFSDVNGPRGGVDLECRILATVSGMPSIIAEHRAAEAGDALRGAMGVLARTLRRRLRRAGRSAGKKRPARPAVEAGTRRAAARPLRTDAGSLIGRRVGRAAANLRSALARPEKERRDVFVDTALEGTSASDRKAGYGATAARNTKLRTSGMTATLEDSRTRPSRKSSRRSANRAKSATSLTQKALAKRISPSARAASARTRAPRRD